jgi:hypothetical protein
VQTYPDSGHKAPRVVENVFRWIQEGNQAAIRKMAKALRGQTSRDLGRPRKTLPAPETLSLMHHGLVAILQSWSEEIPWEELKAKLLRRGSPPDMVKALYRGNYKSAANLMIESHTKVKSRKLAGALAEGRRRLRQPQRQPGLYDIAMASGKWDPLTEFLATVPGGKKLEVLLSFFPDLFTSPSS